MSLLAAQNCVHRPAGEAALKSGEISKLLRQLDSWSLEKQGEMDTIARNFPFPDFRQGLEFVNKVGAEADLQDHHPEITLEWGKVRIRWWTHTVGGLSENDFIMAAKIDELLANHLSSK